MGWKIITLAILTWQLPNTPKHFSGRMRLFGAGGGDATQIKCWFFLPWGWRKSGGILRLGALQVLRCLCPLVPRTRPGQMVPWTPWHPAWYICTGQYCTPQTHCGPVELGHCESVTDWPEVFCLRKLIVRSTPLPDITGEKRRHQLAKRKSLKRFPTLDDESGRTEETIVGIWRRRNSGPEQGNYFSLSPSWIILSAAADGIFSILEYSTVYCDQY